MANGMRWLVVIIQVAIGLFIVVSNISLSMSQRGGMTAAELAWIGLGIGIAVAGVAVGLRQRWGSFATIIISGLILLTCLVFIGRSGTSFEGGPAAAKQMTVIVLAFLQALVILVVALDLRGRRDVSTGG